MARLYHPEAHVDVSWYRGDGAGFVAASKKNADGTTLTFHQLSSSVATICGDRAIVETGCSLHGILELHGADVAMVGYTRLMWRVQRHEGCWKIAGLSAVYISDMLLPRNPNRVPPIDETVLATFRPSYKYLSYVIHATGRHINDDLPGIDRPESVLALREADRAWLRTAAA
jgi:hypothetical protein